MPDTEQLSKRTRWTMLHLGQDYVVESWRTGTFRGTFGGFAKCEDCGTHMKLVFFEEDDPTPRLTEYDDYFYEVPD